VKLIPGNPDVVLTIKEQGPYLLPSDMSCWRFLSKVTTVLSGLGKRLLILFL
jgi:hypothetical protein